ncbi:MAG TPA: hypothetical protein VKW76_09445 [Candidatus Binatia bacterium]|nr:hypothetical protein [Candidatus Binatia bacterium]
MRALPAVALLAVLAALPIRAQEPVATTTTTTLPPPPEQHVKILGTPPDLTGRWLVVGDVEAGGAGRRATVAFWEVGKAADGQLDLRVRSVGLPPPLQKALDDAGNQKRAWVPAPADLAAIAADWDRLPQQLLPIGRIDTEVAGRDGFDDGMKAEPTTKDATWIVRQVETFLPSGAPMMRQVLLYAALGPSDDGYTGNYALLMLAAAPFPIPISLNGTFHAYRLPSPSRGLFARILDVFTGCGAGRR